MIDSVKPKILVVDDAGPVVILCVNVLQALGYSIKAANRGEMAVDLIRKEQFDLLVVDYKMPGMNGFEVLDQARQARPRMASGNRAVRHDNQRAREHHGDADIHEPGRNDLHMLLLT